MRYFDIGHTFISIRAKTMCQPGFYSSPTNIYSAEWSYRAERVWEETELGVKYIKDNVPWGREVDMKEFLWVKLRAKPI